MSTGWTYHKTAGQKNNNFKIRHITLTNKVTTGTIRLTNHI